ncbi:hypothetical protein VB773_21100 [Haloarculaceae archaeon H-GB2-1]|nr:hypothetical protein [Haloarculaceae archaeon H-GB1-1]MEA5389382.1 hypothetical protein [Haloarculaceae archaeon H-GB11]MEA5409819.1 hypothetical protein [Haloarculaceae archaeon H-GB2-1]
MCQFCSNESDDWEQLLEYDDKYDDSDESDADAARRADSELERNDADR